MAKPVRSVRVLGKRFRVERPKYLGRHDEMDVLGDTTVDPPRIRVRAGLADLEELDTWVHELLHAAHWHHDETHVAEMAEDIARVLWRLGYRRTG